jgi:predicted class III extradiol MEMO1 family dioxygenase
VHRLSRSHASPASLSTFPVHASIEALDREALELLTLPGRSASAVECHQAFAAYLLRTKNTICGRHPIGLLLGVLAHLEKQRDEGDENGGNKSAVVKWVRYAQSSQCFNISDSSVSYASAYVVF